MQYRIHPGGRVLSRKAGAGRPIHARTLARKVLGRGRPCRADAVAALHAAAVDAAAAAAYLREALARRTWGLSSGDVQRLAERLAGFAAAVNGRAAK